MQTSLRKPAPGLEELREDGAARFGQDVPGDADAVVQAGLVEQAEDRLDGAGLRVGRPVDEAVEARQDHRPRAHRARFQGHVEGA